MIRGESGPRLELEESLEQTGSWEEDWNSLLLPLVDKEQPAYFLYRSVYSYSTLKTQGYIFSIFQISFFKLGVKI